MSVEKSLNEMERDALTELVNIGVGRAASSLRKMTDRQVMLSIPAVEIVDRQAAPALIGVGETDILTVVQQDFHGAFTGRALLIFPDGNAEYLTRAVLGEAFGTLEIAELQDGAVVETGNIILNALLSSIANMLQRTLQMSPPHLRRGASDFIFNVVRMPDDGSGFVLFLHINFSVRDRQVEGYLAMIMDLPSLIMLKELIAAYIQRVTKDAH